MTNVYPLNHLPSPWRAFLLASMPGHTCPASVAQTIHYLSLMTGRKEFCDGVCGPFVSLQIPSSFLLGASESHRHLSLSDPANWSKILHIFHNSFPKALLQALSPSLILWFLTFPQMAKGAPLFFFPVSSHRQGFHPAPNFKAPQSFMIHVAKWTHVCNSPSLPRSILLVIHLIGSSYQDRSCLSTP